MLIDPGSELTFISEAVVNLLDLPRRQSSIPIIGIGGTNAASTRGLVEIKLKSRYSEQSVDINAHVLKGLSSTLPSCAISTRLWPQTEKLQLADPHYTQPHSVDIIIGADSYGQIIKPNIIKHSSSMPIAQLTIFGWTILGPINSSSTSASISHQVSIDSTTQDLQDLLSKFWIQEEVPADDSTDLTPEEQICEDHFITTHSRHSSGRYIVRLPLKTSAYQLGKSYTVAHHCLQSLLRRIKKEDSYFSLYSDFLREYEDLGHMVKAQESHPDSVHYYLPHHGVLREDSVTTKLRVVFNGSKATYSGVSLNDVLYTGAKLQTDIFDVLLWVRRYRFVFATDITKMFRQIMVDPRDWDLQRILWIDNQFNVIPYQLTTVTYGTRPAPFLSMRVLLQLVEDEGHNYPLATDSLKHARYVDDIFGGADDFDGMQEVANQLSALCMKGGFPLAKWASNDPRLQQLKHVKEDLNSKLIQAEDCSSTVLGLLWSSGSDHLTFKLTDSPPPVLITKRLVLSEIAQLFDPLGLLSPIIIRAKVLMQELWLEKLSWDDHLSSHICRKWLTYREEFKDIPKISIPRWIQLATRSEVELHGFSDASQMAMAATVYLKVYSPEIGTRVTLVCLKTKVAPLKRLTIPRLELTAALLLAKLMAHCRSTLNLDDVPTILWTDSAVTLAWINSHPSRWKDFVPNRVSAIQEVLQNGHWRFVPGKDNPADCATRGLTPQQLSKHSLWWTGPPWLLKAQQSWPTHQFTLDPKAELEERPGLAFQITIDSVQGDWDLPSRCSTVLKLQRVTALCFRVAAVCKRVPGSTFDYPFTTAELARALSYWTKWTQAQFFSFEIRMLSSMTALPKGHPFTRLTAFLDTEGIIRVGGRLNNSDLDRSAKHPAILPRNSTFTTLIISDAHHATLHGGTQLTLARIRQRFWIIGGRQPVRSFVLKCVKCSRQRGERARQLMGQLPVSRVTAARAFLVTGVDYAGPFKLRTWRGRGAKTSKGWLCIFVCFATSAVHLEAVSDYSADAFIAAFRRFTGRRGICQTLHSDCGTTFVGADSEIKRLFTQGTQEFQALASAFSTQQVTWIFNPRAAPHMGGKWEAGVKSVKHHLVRTIGGASLTFEEFTTLLVQVEAVLNSRPLEPLTDDPDDLSMLTPGHFLIGDALMTLPEPTLTDLASSRLSRWQFIQQQLQCFWKKWSSSYLHHLQSISKWHHPSTQVQLGSIVLISDERFPPTKWPLARVTALHPGQDGLTRVVTIRTATTTLTRPIAKLVVLPVPHRD